AVDVHRLLALTYLYDDEPEKARKEVSTLLRLDSTFEAASPALFAALVAQVRREEQVTQVASVSKTSESLREAPATVVVVTGEEIQRRGYLDLEQLLHDLPGFDISRLNGDIYSHIYQRGYRSPINDRLLLLIDGVEQNELSTNTLYLSRQYSLTNVDRVEVIYGPASTMYGANAYTGVISIITREPDTLVGENGRFGMLAQTTYGGYGTR
ncbi:MAG TPA: TonB-dependent receptor plug domain-containing protein, partial [Thermoanaerobaculia bacterium]|nr:TonB-dependent receptor plug domain-containing protein [Thermoanaerobaculia bacterium]